MSSTYCPLENPTETQVQRARDLVMRFGWNVVSYQILNPGMELWFSSRRDAVVGFVRRNRVRVVAGAPVCDEEFLEEVIEEWEAAAKQQGESVCYFAAAGRMHDLLSSQEGYSTVVLGAQPVWTPVDWPNIFKKHRKRRGQLARAARRGVVVSEWAVERAAGSSALKQILAQWLRTRGLPSLHFLVEPRTLDCLGDRRLFVGEMDGQPLGFVVLSPAPRRNGYLIEQFVRGPAAPNGAMELILTTAIAAIADEGATYVTMGLVPLSEQGGDSGNNPFWLRLLLKWTKAHGRRFYDFDGLEQFKAKFEPREWEPIYAISNEANFSPRTLYAVASAFTQRPVWVSLSGGLRRSVRRELKWWLEKRAAHAREAQTSADETGKPDEDSKEV